MPQSSSTPRPLPRNTNSVDPKHLLHEFNGLLRRITHPTVALKINVRGSMAFSLFIAGGRPNPDPAYFNTFDSLKYWAGFHASQDWLRHKGNEPEKVDMGHVQEVVLWARRCLCLYAEFAPKYRGEEVKRYIIFPSTQRLLGMPFDYELLRVRDQHLHIPALHAKPEPQAPKTMATTPVSTQEQKPVTQHPLGPLKEVDSQPSTTSATMAHTVQERKSAESEDFTEVNPSGGAASGASNDDWLEIDIDEAQPEEEEDEWLLVEQKSNHSSRPQLTFEKAFF